MSSRQVRKLQRQQELLKAQQEPGGDEAKDKESEHDSLPAKPRSNAFSAFAALGGDDGDDDEDGEDDQEELQAQAPQQPQPNASTPSKKPKRSKKKKKGKQSEVLKSTKTQPKLDDPTDEISRALEELDLKLADKIGATSKTSDVDHPDLRITKLLSINFHHLKVVNEMRRLFGKEAIEAAQAEDESESAANRARRPRQVAVNVDLETFLKGQPGKGLPDVVLRRNPFIDGRSHWPRGPVAGLTMRTVGEPQGYTQEFAFSHDKSYESLDASFFGLVQMHDPMQLVYFLHRNPYHINTLIQVSKVAKQDQNSALSAELCEKALFTLGRVTLSTFRKRLEQGQARMEFRRPENRQFWLAGYHYIKMLIMKGTYRTALEWVKLYVSLDHTDPYAFGNWVQVLAIKAHEASWFIDICGTDLLGGTYVSGDFFKQTLTLAHLQRGDKVAARASLVTGIQQMPWLYSALFKALNLDAPKSIWGALPRHSDELLHTELYIHMTKDLWNNAQATALLVEAADAAEKLEPGLAPSTAMVSLGTARFVYLDNTPSLMALVPRQQLHANPNFDFDPLPPPREENIFSAPTQELPWMPTAPGDISDHPALARMLQNRDLEGMIRHLQGDEQELPEEQNARDGTDAAGDARPRGTLRQMIDMLVEHMPAADLAEFLMGPDPRVPGGWFDDEDEVDDEHDEDGLDWDGPNNHDDFLGVDDFGDTVDDDGMPGDAHDDDDDEDDDLAV